MKKTKEELGKQFKSLTEKIDEYLAKAETEERSLTEEESAELEKLEAEADGIQAEIEKLNAEEERKKKNIKRRELLDSSTMVTRPMMPVGEGSRGLNIPAHVARMRPEQLRGFGSGEDAYIAGQWCLGTLLGRQDSLDWLRSNGFESLAQVGYSNTLGGYLVPEEFHSAIIDLRENYGIFRQKADVAPMGSDTATWPKRLSGLTTYFVGEGTAINDSDMTYGQISLTARKLAAMCKISNDLAEDAVVNIAQRVAQEVAYAFAVKEDQCGFLGTGASTYGGIVGLITACTTATATTVTAATGNTAFSTLDLTDFEAMLGKLPEYPGLQPEWYISKAGWAASMMRLADAAGGNTAEVIEGRRKPMFLGYPVNLVQCMNTTLTAQTSTKGLCYFGDLAIAATLGDRRGVRLDSTTDRYFEYDQLAIKGTERFDINCHSVGNTTTAGAIVMLATPAS